MEGVTLLLYSTVNWISNICVGLVTADSNPPLSHNSLALFHFFSTVVVITSSTNCTVVVQMTWSLFFHLVSCCLSFRDKLILELIVLFFLQDMVCRK